MHIGQLNECQTLAGGRFFGVEFYPKYGVYWATFRPDAPRHFTPEFIADLRAGQERLVSFAKAIADTTPVHYQVLSSAIPDVFSFGGDLALFLRLIEQDDREALMSYATSCIELVYHTANAYNLPLITISLLQGDALGGGLEAALAADVIIAEKQCKLGFPEILFGMFPGMGAIQLLRRHLSETAIEALLRNGRTHSAEAMRHMGLVQVLADTAHGEQAAWSYIQQTHRQWPGPQALRQALRASGSTICRSELHAVAEIWVDNALRTTARQRKIMEHLLRAADKCER